MIAKDEISMEEVESSRCAFRAGSFSVIVFLLVLALLLMQMLKTFTDALPMSP